MKTKSILIGLLTFFALGSCDNTNSEYMTVNVATPKFMTLEALRSSVEITEPTPIIESGKIYVYKDLVLVNDVDRGIHVIDNSNPENPKKVAFITIKANKDMEIKGDYLYVDSLMDLVVFNISEINNIKEVTRLKDVFPQYVIMPFVENMIVDYGDQVPNANEIIVSWTITEERRRIEEIDDLNTRFMNDLALAEANTSVGQGGSLARFKIVEDYLYAVDSHSINIFDINNLETPLGCIYMISHHQLYLNIFQNFNMELLVIPL
jgi:hypothetical protein